MKNILNQLKSKTVWGGLLLAAANIPKLAPYSSMLTMFGTALAGAGVAHKLDKIKEAIKAPVENPTSFKL
jgi:hypothetical protein